MPALQIETSIGAGLNNNNVFSGSAFEFARTRQILSLGVVAAATGTFITVQAGSDVILEESPPMVLTTMPIIPDHMYYNDVMEAGDRLKVAVRNPTGGAVIHRALALVTQV